MQFRYSSILYIFYLHSFSLFFFSIIFLKTIFFYILIFYKSVCDFKLVVQLHKFFTLLLYLYCLSHRTKYEIFHFPKPPALSNLYSYSRRKKITINISAEFINFVCAIFYAPYSGVFGNSCCARQTVFPQLHPENRSQSY